MECDEQFNAGEFLPVTQISEAFPLRRRVLLPVFGAFSLVTQVFEPFFLRRRGARWNVMSSSMRGSFSR